jgi:peptidyl-prolyl cis-trans isomerase SurA
VVRRRVGGTISVGEDEVDEALARLEANKGRPEYRVAEIFLAVESPERESEVRRTVENLVTQLRVGATFSAIAQQFSQSATSAVGGDIGWLVAGQLPQEIDKALVKLEPGQISDAIRTFEGFYIITLLDRRTALTADPLDTQVHLVQVVVTKRTGESRRPFERLDALRREVEDCPALLSRAKEIASPLSGDLGTVRLGDLPADIRDAVKDLTAGQTSQSLSFEQGVRIFMVCDRTEAEVALPDRSLVRQDIGGRRMELLARRYLRDLRRSSFVDFRL